MSDFPNEAKVVIIGGGVVGASSLFHWLKLVGPIAFYWKKMN